jgi:hypothetical protein
MAVKLPERAAGEFAIFMTTAIINIRFMILCQVGQQKALVCYRYFCYESVWYLVFSV